MSKCGKKKNDDIRGTAKCVVKFLQLFDIYCDLKYLMQTHGNMETIYFICLKKVNACIN